MGVVVLLSAKGGVGKTATTVGLFGAAEAAGVPVTGLDVDRQGDLLRWLGPERVTHLPLPTAKALAAVLPDLGASGRLVLVDVPPGLPEGLTPILEAADLVVGVTGPGFGELAVLPVAERVVDYDVVIGCRFDLRRKLDRSAVEQLTKRYGARWLGVIPARQEVAEASAWRRLLRPESDVHQAAVGLFAQLAKLNKKGVLWRK